MSTTGHLSWENFLSTVAVPGEDRAHRISTKPQIDVYSSHAAGRIGIRLEIKPATSVPKDLSRIKSIGVEAVQHAGKTFLDIFCVRESIHREFYHLATAISERVLAEAKEPTVAAGLELGAFDDLLREHSTLSVERQVGLLGELLVLQRLVKAAGPSAIDSWLGPTGEPHDFRTGTTELEVKSTLAAKRIHTIHGDEQLVPSMGCSLYLTSIVLGPAGGQSGLSLARSVAEIHALLGGAPQLLRKFDVLLERCDFPLSEAGTYDRQFALRRPMAVVPIDTSFPAITRPSIQSVLGPQAGRVGRFQYDVQVEGLESEEPAGEFNRVFENLTKRAS